MYVYLFYQAVKIAFISKKQPYYPSQRNGKFCGYNAPDTQRIRCVILVLVNLKPAQRSGLFL